ncbi:transposase, partial [Carnobacteriaceae bacterium 52-44]
MVTLQENTVQFNNKLIVSHNGGQLSSDSGLTLMDELMDAFHFTQLSEEIITFTDNRKYCKHSNSKILKQLILQLTAGYKADTSADILQYDPVLLTFASGESLASQPTISRLWDRTTEETIEDFQKLNQVLIDQARLVRN